MSFAKKCNYFKKSIKKRRGGKKITAEKKLNREIFLEIFFTII